MTSKINKIIPLSQRSYGGTNDCSLTSMTSILMYESCYGDSNYVYGVVECECNKYLYSTERYGLFSFCIRKILSNILKTNQFYSPKRRAKSGYIKGIGYSFNRIKKIINNDHILMMNVTNLGKYKNHSVTIVGYKDDKTLYLYDNWSTDLQCINYSDIPFLSSINWVE